MMTQGTALARRLLGLARLAMRIEAEQEATAGYADNILRSIVNAELRKLEEAMGVSLDDVAAGLVP